MKIKKGSFNEDWSKLQRRALNLLFDGGDSTAVGLSLSVTRLFAE